MKETERKNSDDWEPYELYKEFQRRLGKYQVEKKQSESSIADFIEFSDLHSLAHILEDDADFTFESETRLIVPKLDAETVLKTIEIISRCKMKGAPIHSIILLTDDLNNEIEMLTDYLFSISEILGTKHITRFYVPWTEPWKSM
ncbi:MAG: hypothetical protein GF411_00835 [Candidatus Lokiarchaeota archaeon]|nr:hypothetical protein [Candidatus Lokiarchaeota archaeon]